MILAVILLSATGYLSYRNLSSIVASIQLNLKPDLRFSTIQEVSMDLEKAQNSIRIYTNTHDSLDLRPYYTVIYNIDAKVSRLHSECISDSLLIRQTDTISKLIEKNIDIWNQLLYLQNNYKVAQNLKQLSVRLDSNSIEDNKTESSILKRVFSRANKNRLNEKEIISDLREIEQQDSITKVMLTRRESK